VPRLFITRLLETFFRRWWLFLIPIVPFIALGVFTVVNKGDTYRSSAVLLVSRDSPLSDIGSFGGNDFGGNTPAGYTSAQIMNVLSTEKFLDSVIQEAGLDGAVTTGAITPEEIRSSIWAAVAGDELVSVNASTDNARLSFELVQATIDSYASWEADIVRSEIENLEVLRNARQELVDEAAASLDPDAVERAQDELDQVTTAIDNAESVLVVYEQGGAGRLPVVDAPTEAAGPDPKLRDAAITMALYGGLGLLVAAATLVVATLADRSVRYGDELEQRLHLDVLAAIPDSRSPTPSVP
jgi:uncharacterized protein involved in exopolysaccharide biosynthesis